MLTAIRDCELSVMDKVLIKDIKPACSSIQLLHSSTVRSMTMKVCLDIPVPFTNEIKFRYAQSLTDTRQLWTRSCSKLLRTETQVAVTIRIIQVPKRIEVVAYEFGLIGQGVWEIFATR